MVDKGRLDALKVALDNEMKEREFYLKMAKQARHPIGRLLFEKIADEELEHYERLKQVHERWKRGEQWPESLPLEVNGTRVNKILRGIVRKIDEVKVGTDAELRALRKAIEFEQKGARHYAELGMMVSDPKEKRFFELMSSIENEHYLSLKDTEEYLIDPASWYRKVEHHTLDGA